MELQSPRFVGIDLLEKCLNGKREIVYRDPPETDLGIERVQQALIDLGYSIPSGATSNYMQESVDAVKLFQQASGLIADGRFGKNTMQALDDAILAVDRTRPEPDWAPQVIVKLLDTVTPPIEAEIDFAQLLAGLPPALVADPVAAQLASHLGEAPIRRVFNSVGPAELNALVAEARVSDPTYAPPNLNAFLEIDCSDSIDPEPIIALLTQWTEVVETAYLAGGRSDPGVVGTTNPFFAEQGYLLPAPTGIGVQTAWAKGADGSGIDFIDLEKGWFLGHNDLPKSIRLLEGARLPASDFHGTAVLGIVAGVDNGEGVVGIAPNAVTNVFSHLDPDFPTWGDTPFLKRNPSAIFDAARRLSFGDVLLIEKQRVVGQGVSGRLLPVETDLADWVAIRLATARGVIVVEAAGNGKEHLDTYRDERLNINLLNRSAGPPDFQDSGAIMVAACTPTVPREAGGDSNIGSRIDCHAWGEGITTTGDPDNPSDPDGYIHGATGGFGGTSGASAIIAGVCLLVQHLCSILKPIGAPYGRFGPYEMRALLRRLENGTDLEGNVPAKSSGELGCMPNLTAIIANEFTE